MIHARITFAPDLNAFLSPSRRSGAVAFTFDPGQTVKHLVESAGVPHTEVGRVEAGGSAVDLSYQVRDGDELVIYPPAPGEGLPPGDARFVLDNHLGRLAAYLRMLGFDSLYRNDYADEELAQVSAEQERILLTRDRRLLMRKTVRYGCCLRSLDTLTQLREVLRRCDLLAKIVPFRRCLRCNAPLQQVQKGEVLDRLEPLTRRYYQDFHRCPNCGQVYWKGSHYERMLATIERLRSEDFPGPGGEGQPPMPPQD